MRCAVCGKVHERETRAGRTRPTCSGHRSDGAPCANWPIKGGTVCAQRHGGSAPQVRRSALVRVEEARARGILERLEHPEPGPHPVVALLRLADEVVAWQSVLRDRLGELTTLATKDSFGAERERAVVLLYERALDRSAKLLTDLAKLDLQARALKLDEQTAAGVVRAVVEALRRVGLADREVEVRAALAEVLREREMR